MLTDTMKRKDKMTMTTIESCSMNQYRTSECYTFPSWIENLLFQLKRRSVSYSIGQDHGIIQLGAYFPLSPSYNRLISDHILLRLLIGDNRHFERKRLQFEKTQLESSKIRDIIIQSWKMPMVASNTRDHIIRIHRRLHRVLQNWETRTFSNIRRKKRRLIRRSCKWNHRGGW